jgi:hypothetical protein
MKKVGKVFEIKKQFKSKEISKKETPKTVKGKE